MCGRARHASSCLYLITRLCRACPFHPWLSFFSFLSVAYPFTSVPFLPRSPLSSHSFTICVFSSLTFLSLRSFPFLAVVLLVFQTPFHLASMLSASCAVRASVTSSLIFVKSFILVPYLYFHCSPCYLYYIYFGLKQHTSPNITALLFCPGSALYATSRECVHANRVGNIADLSPYIC